MITEISLKDVIKLTTEKERAGSRLRCLMLTNFEREKVAELLTNITDGNCIVTANDFWMPQGFNDTKEAQLGKESRLVPDKTLRAALMNWWLAVYSNNTNTPNWDIASTCTINDKKGLLLVEAKAHKDELHKDGKKLESSASENSKKNHEHIKDAINEANQALGNDWKLSRDSHYQLSNRFAWSWKLVSMGIPVVLVYLGFLNAEEMKERGSKIFKTHDNWVKSMQKHVKSILPNDVWGREIDIDDSSFIPILKSMQLDIDVKVTAEIG